MYGYLATTPTGSVALIVHATGIETVWSAFTEADLRGLLVQGEDDAITGGYLPGQFGAYEELEASLTALLPTIGKRLMAPVARRLHELGLDQVVLIPSGRLSLLPLHVACYSGCPACRTPVDERDDHAAHRFWCPTCAQEVTEPRLMYFLDAFTVSYAPNARTLATAQREAQRRRAPLSLVGVGNPLPHPRPLPAALAEMEEITTFFPEDGRYPLYTDGATRQALLYKLPQGTYLHFACHGAFALDAPLDSQLDLSGGEKLTLRDILYGDAQPVHARLVVLSACQSALSDVVHLPDEYIGFPAGFLQAGVPGVVGTLWSVNDLSTALVMIKFYELHLRGEAPTGAGPMPPALALCRAQCWLRDVTSGELAEYFAGHHDLNTARRQLLARLPEGVVSEALERFGWDDPEARPFSDRPYHWAPFLFVGV